MEKRRPVTRICLVLPAEERGSSVLAQAAQAASVLPTVLGGGRPERPSATLEALADLCAAALSVHGVQVSRRVAGAAGETAARVDAALWFPDDRGEPQVPDVRDVPARVHVGLVASATPSPRALQRFDALIVPHASLLDAVRRAAARVPGRAPPVLVARLPLSHKAARDAEKALRDVAGLPVVLVDVRDDFDASIDRVVFQLALKVPSAALVLLSPREERARARVRSLCERHGVDAWLASGDEGFASSVAAADLCVGRPDLKELLLLAAHRVAVAWLGDEGRTAQPLALALREAGALDEVTGVLQLAAALERRLVDVGALHAKGMMLGEALVGADRAFLDALASIEPLAAAPSGSDAWEPVGPHAGQRRAGEPAVVEAAGADRVQDRATRIEDALLELKAKMREGQQGGGRGP